MEALIHLQASYMKTTKLLVKVRGGGPLLSWLPMAQRRSVVY